MSPLPFVSLNMAMTADGKIATANRALSSFGSARDHAHLLELRTQADAVMAGARTVDLNPVTLGPGGEKFRKLRLKRGLKENNLRVIVSGSGSVNPQAEVFRHTFSPILILTTARASAQQLELLRSLSSAVRVCGEKELDVIEALTWLKSEWAVNHLLCEGGGALNDALFRAGVVNELHLTVCPKIFGGRDAPTIADGLGIPNLGDALQLQIKSIRRVAQELFLSYTVKNQVRARP